MKCLCGKEIEVPGNKLCLNCLTDFKANKFIVKKIIKCNECEKYYDSDKMDYEQTAADDYIFQCPEGHNLIEDELLDMDDCLQELNYLQTNINNKNRNIKEYKKITAELRELI